MSDLERFFPKFVFKIQHLPSKHFIVLQKFGGKRLVKLKNDGHETHL